ncbi:hypothetical protein ES708_02156 [subsurface metagenome]
MKDDQQRIDSEHESDIRECPLLIKDIVRYLLSLAALNRDPRTGNADLSESFRELANALRPHSHRSIREISDVIGEGVSRTRKPTTPRAAKATLPVDLRALSSQGVDEILKNRNYTKLQLVELGIQRFGISKSRLMQLTKDEVCESIRAALNHERSLGVISQEARRGGDQRSS